MVHFSPYTSGARILHRRFVQIPRSQQELLDRDDAWKTDGVVNVPVRVLADLRDFHRPKPSLVPQQRMSTSDPKSSPLRTTEKQASSEEDDEDPDNSDIESQHSAVTWSPSPEHHRHPQYVLEEPPQSSPPRPENGYSPPPPPAPLPRAVSRSRTSFLNVFPSSSLGSEAEIEIEPPQAMTDVVERINRAARAAPPQPTPPSAQLPIIPSTYTAEASPPNPPSKRLRRMKAPPFGSTQPSGARPPTTSVLLPAAQTEQDHSPASHSSHSTSTANSQCQEIASVVAPSPLSAVTTAQVSMEEQISEDLLRRPETSQESPTLSKIPPNGPASQFPFTAYMIAYPYFTGSQGDFIRAAMCLEDLRKKKALPEFLYDDFIRVFCGPYLQYIEHLGNVDGRKPLTTIQWYNDNVSKPVYDKGVITKANVADVMERYPDQVRTILGGIDDDQNRNTAEKSTLETTPTQERPAQHLPPFAIKETGIGPHRRYSRRSQERQERQERTTGELLSDPISTADPSQGPRRQSLHSVSPQRASTDRSTDSRMPTPEVRRGKNRLSEIQLDSDLLDGPSLLPFPETVMQTQDDAMDPSRRRSTPAEAPSSTAMSGISSVPETAMKPKVSSRSLNRSASESSPSMFKKPRSGKRKRDNILWGKFLDQKLSQAKRDSS